MKALVEELLPKYDDTDRNGKGEITARIVRMVHSEGGRFLRSHHARGAREEIWQEVSDESARQKVGHTIRDMRKMKARETQEGYYFANT